MLEAKAIWELTCIAGGFIGCVTNKTSWYLTDTSQCFIRYAEKT